MNEDQWYEQHVNLCGIFTPDATEQQIEGALRGAPDTLLDGSVRHLAAWRPAWTQGAQASFWRRSFAGQPTPKALDDPHGGRWERNADGHLVPLDITECEIDTPAKLYVWMSGYVYAARVSDESAPTSPT